MQTKASFSDAVNERERKNQKLADAMDLAKLTGKEA